MAEPAIIVTQPIDFIDDGDLVRQTVRSGPVNVEVHMRWDDFVASQTNAARLVRDRELHDLQADAAALADSGRGYDPGTRLVLDAPEVWLDGGLAHVRFRTGDTLHSFAMPAHLFLAFETRARTAIAEWRRSQRPPAPLRAKR